jgi:hypothetical protein
VNHPEPVVQAATRIRAYLDVLPDTQNVGAEIAYGRQFHTPGWPRDFYVPQREDLELLLSLVLGGTDGC